MAAVVANGHPLAATPADDQPLEKSRSLTGRAVASVSTVGLPVLVQAAQVIFVIGPSDVAGVGVRDEGMPLLPRQAGLDYPPVGGPAALAAAVGESPRVARVLEDAQGSVMEEGPPHQFPLART